MKREVIRNRKEVRNYQLEYELIEIQPTYIM